MSSSYCRSKLLRLSTDSPLSIFIGDEIQLKVLKINGTAVEIEIQTPKPTPIYRNEVDSYFMQKRNVEDTLQNLKKK